MSSCPVPIPKEFREDVVAVARSRDSGVTIKQIATDFGISEATLQNWLRHTDVEDENRPGQTAADADVLRAYRINALHDAHHDDPTFGYRYPPTKPGVRGGG